MATRHNIYSAGAAIDETVTGLAGKTLIGLTLHASAAPTTADVLYVKLDSGLGSAYDTTLYSLTLSTGSTTDICKTDIDLPLYTGDGVRVQFANSDGNTFGIQLLLE